MRVESTAEIAGLPVLEVRRFLRETMHNYGWRRELLKAVLNLSDRRSAVVLRQLSSEDYIEICPTVPGAWRNTTKRKCFGLRLSRKVAPPSYRSERLIEFMDRVHFVNSPACEFLFWIEEVALFGSMLTQQERVNEIDVCVRLERKIDGEAFSKAADLRSELARQNGRSFKNILDQLYWAEYEVRLYLKNRSRAISLVEWDAKWLGTTPHKVLYRRSTPVPPTELV